MSSRLAKFASTSRIRVDPALAERWEFDAARYGEAPIKSQVAHAKRTATTLRNALTQFKQIRPEQEAALKAAASAMTSLATELAPLVPWAKAYQAFCVAEHARENIEELEALATARWGTDDAAVRFEADLVQELGTSEGRLAFAQWLHSRDEHTDVPLDGISSCIDRLGEGSTVRQKLAYRLREDRRATNNQWGTRQGMRLIASFAIYERYLAHRKDVAAEASSILKSFA
jgi:hypothetical protein